MFQGNIAFLSQDSAPCEAGRYSPDASTKNECKLCDAGKSTNNKVGQTSESLHSVSAGQYSDEKGSGSCKECASGYFISGEEKILVVQNVQRTNDIPPFATAELLVRH